MVNTMENHSFRAIVADKQGIHFHEELVSRVKRKFLDEKLIQFLKNANIWNLSDTSGNTLLHISAQCNNIDLIKFLIEYGSRINVQNNLKKTPLIVAIENCCVQSTETLLEAYADVFLSDYSGKNALHWFYVNLWFDYIYLVWLILNRVEIQCSGNSEVIADKLLDAGWKPYNVILLRNTEVTKIMLHRGCHVDAREPQNERTVLHEAVLSYEVEHVELLLNCNADPNAMDRFHRTPLHYVYSHTGKFTNERLTILKMLIDRGALLVTTDGTLSWGQVDYALRYGSREAIEVLLRANLNLSQINEVGNNSVHLLASNTNPDVFKALAGCTFEVDSRNFSKETPLIIAATYGNSSTVEFLLGRGADVNAVASNDISPLYRCVDNFSSEFETKFKDCVQLLLEHGADMDVMPSAEYPSVFNLVRKFNRYVIGDLLVAHVALQKATGKRIAEIIYHRIRSHPPFNNYYNLCKQQLYVKLYKSVRLLDLLIENDVKFECYMRNEKLTSSIERFSNEWKMKLEYFDTLLQKRYTKAVKLLKLKKEAAHHLCELVKTDYYRHPLIADRIVSYLNEEDLPNFLKVPL